MHICENKDEDQMHGNQRLVLIPPANLSFRGVSCFQPVHDSMILSFRHSVITF